MFNKRILPVLNRKRNAMLTVVVTLQIPVTKIIFIDKLINHQATPLNMQTKYGYISKR
jgi:hypothetical protein